MSTYKKACNRCVSDEGLSAFILDEGEEGGCDYCGRTTPAADIRTLRIQAIANCIHDRLAGEYSDVDSEMVSYDNEEGHYYCETYTTHALLAEVVGLEAEDEVIDDIVDVLPDLTWCKKRLNRADLTDALRSGWQVFVDVVKHHIRYLFYDPIDQLPDLDSPPHPQAFGVVYKAEEGVPPERILDAVGAIVARANLIRTMDAGTILFRARVHDVVEHPSSAAELGPPPRDKASQSNRMSPAGIVMFYGGFDRITAIRETFLPDRERAAEKVVSIAQFRSRKPLTVLDLTNLPSPPSFFADREMFRFSWKRRRRSPVKVNERTHEEATEALHVGREGRHPQAASAGEGADLEALRRAWLTAHGLLPLAEGVLRERPGGIRA
jgi:hypothetical protein